jgi:glycosyltransferase involved in cell wall biosynthesis
MASGLTLDVTRLVTRFSRRTPNGIDRVDFAYAQRFLGEDGSNATGIIWTPLGAARVGAARLRPALDALRRHWRETAPRARATRSIARANVHLNVSQFPIWTTAYARWVVRQPGKPVYFLHDTLPLTHPEYFPAAELPRHRARIANIAATARGVIVASETVGDSLRDRCRALMRPAPPICVAPLGLAPAFTQTPAAPARSADPFFVVLGTIEPRKNHLLLLDVWRAMIRKNPAGTPKLAIVGKRGWENETTFALIDRSPELRPYLFQERAMDTPALCALIDGALGALMPSFAEGYGLPVHEALARGAPVIASDIPAFRAISSPLLKLIDPTDGLAWQTAIESLSAAARECGETRRGPTWDEHFATVEAFLAAL